MRRIATSMLNYKIFMQKKAVGRVCSTLEILHDLSSNRCEPDWFLSSN